jgi:arabinose-5-phosphate isomerase
MTVDEDKIIQLCKEKIKLEAEALLKVREQVDSSYAKAVDAILNSKGRVIVTGLGKTGHIGKK